MTELLPSVLVETNEQPDAAIIWLHGLGSDGHDFESLVPALSLLPTLKVRFVFPHAPRRPVTVNGGMEMRAWYDIYEMTLERKVDMENIDESCLQVEQLIQDQINKGIAPNRIILAGFSQGGVIAYQTALHTKHMLAGVLALSTYLVNGDKVPEADACPNGQTPILIHHGLQDPVVAPVLATQARDILVSKGYSVAYQSYDMPHSVCPEQVLDISHWLNARLA
ncbi:MAG: alpha/beta fold hydrolase [Gammaproteobacteria bacterium]|uniref:alpha/beta hydrolase n=1 Tax=Marinomonas sp. BSi20584 TaxID=1594462 RepID=UPI000C1E6EAD|nr:dienelactone hydrolase family protein [Marinomonas sp. BSi20584]MBU1468170.1 alpha/beta fold hydrolase [Gammaproteobacteria bacterium]MBU2024062.1 alpha/beta fold hydrolase [Gammaproteobacteria bacterium]MBU2317360.1 alpha/beta fold hydrolase [Gammaproteobacteria bacterium]MBU2412674.1 alpha/beta fold hydrolase [Gammaproteobacteria bacterium]PJE54699.1 carboxylesterase [Marinomonas sp. BSi20584]